MTEATEHALNCVCMYVSSPMLPGATDLKKEAP